MTSPTPPRLPGRPREFDRDEALERALEVFWRHGYEGTSLGELTAAMGVNRPSLYAAFGNKEALFRKALDRYADAHLGFIRTALEEPTARTAIEALLRGYAASVTDPRTPPGCLTVNGALASGPNADAIRAELTARRLAGEAALRARLQRARKEGDLPADADPADLARYINTVAQGVAVQASSGANRRQLDRVIDIALRAWPDGQP
jgi:AcrR family transcriptional regulator